MFRINKRVNHETKKKAWELEYSDDDQLMENL